MRVTHFYSYTVRGARALEFPIDMLRHGECWPAGPADAEAITRSFHHDDTADQPRMRTLRIFSRREPVVARWQSFGWNVHDLHDEAEVER